MKEQADLEKSATVKHRDSNIELLRILAMLGIVAHHVGYFGGYEFANDSLSINRLWVQFIQIGGKIGVALFIFISGYFLVKNDSIKISKSVKLWLQIFFYSLPLFLLFVLLGIKSFGIMALVEHCFPLIFQKWWFATAYFLLYLFSPFLNKLLRSLEIKQYVGFLLITGLCWCIIPTFTTQYFMGNELLYFVFLYSVAGFIRLHKIHVSWSATKCILISLLLIILTFGTVVAFDILGAKISFLAENALYFFIFMRSFLVFAIALLLFVGFLKIKIGYKKIINFISPAMFGVYLIHENDCVRDWLWHDIFSLESYSNSNMLIPYTIFVIFVVFIGCTIIELLRIYSIELLSKRFIMFISEKIGLCSEKIQNLVLRKLKQDNDKI